MWVFDLNLRACRERRHLLLPYVISASVFTPSSYLVSLVTNFKCVFLRFSVSSIDRLFSESGKFSYMNGIGAIKLPRSNITAYLTYLSYAFLYFHQVTGNFIISFFIGKSRFDT